LFKLIQYVQDSKLAFKVENYATYVEAEEGESPAHTPSSPILHSLIAFLEALTNLGDEGRIFFEKTPPTSAAPADLRLSYLLLSPTNAFSSVAASARAVILAGGTMSPFDDYKTHLFPSHMPQQITTLSCGHVIPASNLCVRTLASTAPASSENATADALEFSFQKRSDVAMIRQLGVVLLTICSVVPDGVVVFFPSYGYLDEVSNVWQSPNNTKSPAETLWKRMESKKVLFRESKAGSSDDILARYSAAILGCGVTQSGATENSSSQHGAMLLSVIGGKMSEGINFSDRLGRCVVIVGLPYPNITSPEWRARIEYLESSTMARLTSPSAISSAEAAPSGPGSPSPQGEGMPHAQALPLAKQAARDFYENACMRAVNQSIGRAIRHRGDYAAIVLADRRFGTQRIRSKLPGWIRGGMVEKSEKEGLQGLMGSLTTFFRGRTGR
jgi:chromosome transmission fidelity protein 1